MTDIIDLIDQVTAPTCGSCAKPLRPDGPSPDFCGEVCAEAWCRQRGEPLGPDDLAGRYMASYMAGARMTPYATGGPMPAGVPSIAYDDHQWHTRFSSEQPTFLPTTPLPGFRMELTDGRTWPVPPSDGSSPGGAPATAMLIGGQHHGETIGVPNPPRHTLEIIEAAWPQLGPTDSDLHVEVQRVVYRLMCHNGAHWCYVDPRPAAPQRTVHVEGHEPLTVNYHHHDFPRDAWWATITGRHRGVVCELPDELLTNDRAVSRWFAERSRTSGWPVTDGSWDVTDQRPPWRHDLLPIGARFTLPTRSGVWTITAHAEQSFAEVIQDRAPRFDYTMRNELGLKMYVSREFLTDAVGVRRLPDSAE